MKKINIVKTGNDYTAWLVNTGHIVEIVKINEYALGSGERVRYRVDYNGKTIHSLLPLDEAKSKARKILRETEKKLS